MSIELTRYNDDGRKETPVQRFERMRRENDNTKVEINVHYSETAGSDPFIIGKIAEALDKKLPFGLKCQRSNIIFIPDKLKAYWLWNDGEQGPVFHYNDDADLVTGVKLQYMSHKDLVTTEELTALAKIILLQNALDNAKEWEIQKKCFDDRGAGAVPGIDGAKQR